MNNFIKKTLLLLSLATVLFFTNIQAQQSAHTIIIDKMNYLLYLPDGYQTDTLQRWPMIVFLHGAGETGDDVEKVKLLGPPRMIDDGYKFPFIVVSPQSPQHGWRSDFIRKLVLDLQKKYRVDVDRTYLTGLSMGGFGTWHTAQTFPELFAAIVPICGGGDPHNVRSLENMPIWCFHGAKDDVVSISYSQAMVDSLKQHNHPNIKFTIYPEAGHDSWTETYNNEAVYSWMLSHKRFKYQEKPISPEELEKYTGSYSNNNNERREEYILQIITEDNKLKINWSDQYSSVYNFAGEDKFFMAPDQYDYIKFKRDENEQIIGFSIIYNRYEAYYNKKQTDN